MSNKLVVSNKTLMVAIISALLLALIIFFVVILPAEFNRDPTGLGDKLGLLVLSSPDESKQAQNENAENSVPLQENEVTITVPAHKGKEYKFDIIKHGRIVYNWQTLDESNIYFDFHGEPKDDTTGFFESYSIAIANKMNGTATVPFTGSHGWYWKNTTDTDVNIKLTTSGKYKIIGIK